MQIAQSKRCVTILVAALLAAFAVIVLMASPADAQSQEPTSITVSSNSCESVTVVWTSNTNPGVGFQGMVDIDGVVELGYGTDPESVESTFYFTPGSYDWSGQIAYDQDGLGLFRDGGTVVVEECASTTTTTEPPPAVTPPPPLACPEGSILWTHPDVLSRNPRLHKTQQPVIQTGFTVPADEYISVVAQAWDGYDNRVNVTQLNEQFRVRVGGVETGLTTDPADRVASAYTNTQLGNYTFPEGELEFVHIGSGDSPGSVVPSALCLTPKEDPPPTTTTTVPETTTTVPETTTTVPETTTTAPPGTTTTLPPSQGDESEGFPVTPVAMFALGALALGCAALVGARRNQPSS